MKYTAFFKKPGQDKRVRIYTIESKAGADTAMWQPGLSIAFGREGMLLVPPAGAGPSVVIEPGNTLIMKVEK